MNQMIKNSLHLFCLLILAACSLAPGMREPTSFNTNVNIYDITPEILAQNESINAFENYKISTGDTLSIVVFGQPDFFPITNVSQNNPYTSKLVDSNGEIYFPFAGTIKASGHTVAEVRNKVTKKLSENFKEPQVDVSIIKFNNKRNLYILGEVRRPKTINVGLVPLSLADVISEAQGLNTNTARGSRVFVIRSRDELVYQVDMTNASSFLLAGQFTLLPGDIVYVGPADITKWNRFVSQLFPFASFLTQVDNLNSN